MERLMVTLNAPAPDIALEGIADGKVRRFRRSDFRGRWIVLFFYPADFTFVCPSEILGFHTRRAEFAKRDCEILAVSVDDSLLPEPRPDRWEPLAGVRGETRDGSGRVGPALPGAIGRRRG